MDDDGVQGGSDSALAVLRSRKPKHEEQLLAIGNLQRNEFNYIIPKATSGLTSPKKRNNLKWLPIYISGCNLGWRLKLGRNMVAW